MLENELHPVGAIAFAEARGQKAPAPVEVSETDDTMEIKQEQLKHKEQKDGK